MMSNNEGRQQYHYVRCGDMNAYCQEDCQYCAGIERRLKYEADRNSKRISKGLDPLPDEEEFKNKCGIR